MSSVIRISEAASLGLHAMVLLANEPQKALSTHHIAERLGVSETHRSKVLQRLARAGRVVSVRGPGGGFTLAEKNGDTTLLEVYEAIDGPLSDSTCLLGTPVCRGERCILGGLLEATNREVREYLESSTLSELCAAFH